jgi:hypothetical protein
MKPRIHATLAMMLAGLASAQSNISPAKAYAYGAGTGWIHLRPSADDGIRVSEYHLAGLAYGANSGWISFGGGAARTGHSYTNLFEGDYGVNQDGAGNLSGYAWSANLGWINFSWNHYSGIHRPRIDLLTGEFSGYAWSPNAGWIHLGASRLRTESMLRPDSDDDGIGDEWEMAYIGDLTTFSRTGDHDRDGQSDLAEYLAGTDPLVRSPALVLAPIGAARADGLIEFSMVWETRPDRFYVLESATSLDQSEWPVIGTFPGTGGPFSHTHSSADQARFFRVRPQLPLPTTP